MSESNKNNLQIFSYKLTHDNGFAPNPFHGALTLATCKPGIRRTKQVGDWIVGFSSKALCHNARNDCKGLSPDAVIYAGRVTEVLPIGAYFDDPRFESKKPTANVPYAYMGDNIYPPQPFPEGEGAQCTALESDFHDNQAQYKHDLGGLNVLVMEEFYYFGRENIHLPDTVKLNRPYGPTRYGIKTTDQAQIKNLIDWLRSLGKTGQIGLPTLMGDGEPAKGCSPCTRISPPKCSPC